MLLVDARVESSKPSLSALLSVPGIELDFVLVWSVVSSDVLIHGLIESFGNV